MTNKETLIGLSSYDFYRKMKRLFMTKTRSELITWLDSEVSTVSTEEKRISGKHKCPYCGQVWVWSHARWNRAREQGFLVIRCRSCDGEFVAYREKVGIVNEKVTS